MKGFKFLLKNKINKLPKASGVYAFCDRKEILYIGKATNIKERIKNHINQPAYRDNLFIDRVSRLGYIKTNSGIEALILEANLIKKYQPKYNIAWRDDKNYFYIGITKEEFPRVFITHQPVLKSKILNLKSDFVGPFVDGKALKQTLKVLRRVFPYRGCKTLPKRPCLWYQLSRCPAPCLLKSKVAEQIPELERKIKKECQENINNIIKILEAKKIQVMGDLKKEMENASAIQDFERAAKIRDQIKASEKVISHAKVFSHEIPEYAVPRPWQLFGVWKKTEEEIRKILNLKRRISRVEAYDVSNIQGQNATGSMVTFINGQPDKKFYRRFKIHPVKSLRDKFSRVKIEDKPSDVAMLKEVLTRRFQHSEWGWPDLILIDGGKAQLNVATKCLKWRFKHVGVMALAKKRNVAKPRTKLRFGAGENKLFIKGRKEAVLLKNLPREIFNLFLQLRDEAHRFAITYHRKLRDIDPVRSLGQKSKPR